MNCPDIYIMMRGWEECAQCSVRTQDHPEHVVSHLLADYTECHWWREGDEVVQAPVISDRRASDGAAPGDEADHSGAAWVELSDEGGWELWQRRGGTTTSYRRCLHALRAYNIAGLDPFKEPEESLVIALP